VTSRPSSRPSSCSMLRGPSSALVTPGMRDRERHREVRHRQGRRLGERNQLLNGVEPAFVAEGAPNDFQPDGKLRDPERFICAAAPPRLRGRSSGRGNPTAGCTTSSSIAISSSGGPRTTSSAATR
jgi:hypothetical protein